MTKIRCSTVWLIFTIGCSFCSVARADYQDCLLQALSLADDNTLVADIRAQCSAQKPEVAPERTRIEQRFLENKGVITERLMAESKSKYDPYVITPHKPNYLLPVYSTSQIHRFPYAENAGLGENLNDLEAKFQLSVKVPLNTDTIFTTGDALYFGFTLSALWQIYSDNISKPFRETNYTPEVFYLAPTEWQPFGGNTGFFIGAEHQSNGRSQGLSRSWNRLYAGLLFEYDRFAMAIKPWYRLPESEKTDPSDPKGDDNPDIDDYMGHFELTALYNLGEYDITFTGRQNFATHKGAAKIDVTFPLWGRLKGIGTFFTGYGDSLIDYNHNQTRVGVGVSLTTF